eukprot:m.493030 g.493030  ORF g.493030 m.493030 type:complete len:485 (+) comp21791_c0_seq9:263-1717(+)
METCPTMGNYFGRRMWNPFFLLLGTILFPTSVTSQSCNITKTRIVVGENTMTVATSVFGSVSFLACSFVLIVIFAYSKMSGHLAQRYRIIFGLMIANLLYSLANIIPIRYIAFSQADCKPVGLKYHLIEPTVRGIWFGAKYTMVLYCFFDDRSTNDSIFIGSHSPLPYIAVVSRLHQIHAVVARRALDCRIRLLMVRLFNLQVLYELLILAASYHVLRTGQGIPWCYERIVHLLIAVCGMAVFISFVAVTNRDSHNWLQITSDPDERKYFDVEETYMRIWIAPFVLSLALWTALHISAHNIFKRFYAEMAEAREDWKAVYWSEGDKGIVHVKETLFDLQYKGYSEIVRPLGRYVLVFMVFAAPAVAMTTDQCKVMSGSEQKTCYIPCEMMLALRSFCTAVVFFTDKSAREELLDTRVLCRRLRSRLCCHRGKSVVFSLESQRIRTLSPRESWSDNVSGTERDGSDLQQSLLPAGDDGGCTEVSG